LSLISIQLQEQAKGCATIGLSENGRTKLRENQGDETEDEGEIMTKQEVTNWIRVMKAENWYLATHLTILDSRNSYHRMIGKLHFSKPRKEARS